MNKGDVTLLTNVEKYIGVVAVVRCEMGRGLAEEEVEAE